MGGVWPPFTNSRPHKKESPPPPPPEYDTGRFLPETAALDSNLLSDATEFIAVILLDGKILTLSNVCVGPWVIVVGCSTVSYC